MTRVVTIAGNTLLSALLLSLCGLPFWPTLIVCVVIVLALNALKCRRARSLDLYGFHFI